MKIHLSILCAIGLGGASAFAQESPAPSSDGTPAMPSPAPSTISVQPGTPLAPGSSPAVAQPTAAPEASASGSGEPPVAKAQPVNDREVMTQLQIFLDQQNFGPGKIDGRGKLFTAQALDRYRLAHGLPVNGKIDSDIPLDTVYPVYTTYQIKPGDMKFIGEVPSKPAEQAKKKYMTYPSLHEFVAERYHTDPDFLVKINPGVKLENLKVYDNVRVPNVAPFVIENLVENPKVPANPEVKERLITVDTKNRMLDLTEGEKLLASFPITPGSTKLPAPKGTWKILGICELPNFRWDEAMLEHGVRSNDFHMIPMGPRNPVGVMWMGLNKPGIGLHGTNSPWNIGRTGSHGCIRLANWDIVRLQPMVTEGMKVIIK